MQRRSRRPGTVAASPPLIGDSVHRPLKNKEDRFVLEDAIHASESSSDGVHCPAHVFEVTLEPSSFTEEKLALYQSYEETYIRSLIRKGLVSKGF